MKSTETSSPAPANCEVIHSFTQGNPVAERRTRWVMWLTLVVMVLEIAGGWIFNSMALMADGWHMSSHAFALGLTVFAYRMAARYARDRRFAFGTWKMEILGGYTSALLLVGGAGGVGSITVQLLKTLTDIQTIATASRPASRDWVRALGADFVVNHHEPLPAQIAALGIGAPAFVFSTSQSDTYLPAIAELIAPQGRIAVIDDPATLDVNPLKSKSLSLHWEFMFTRALWQTADIAAQGQILREVAALVDAGKIRTTLTERLDGINAANLRHAHALLERGDAIGKVVLSDW